MTLGPISDPQIVVTRSAAAAFVSRVNITQLCAVQDLLNIRDVVRRRPVAGDPGPSVVVVAEILKLALVVVSWTQLPGSQASGRQSVS